MLKKNYYNLVIIDKKIERFDFLLLLFNYAMLTIKDNYNIDDTLVSTSITTIINFAHIP